jgi:heme-degrading monooxygenase HmoA
MPEASSAGQEILSVAVWKAVPDMEAASLVTLRELSSILSTKGYGRDQLYRDRESHYVLLRYWNSEEARRAAQEDPDMLRCWARLGNEISIVRVYETLSEVRAEKTR